VLVIVCVLIAPIDVAYTFSDVLVAGVAPQIVVVATAAER
jgi:hypothetical protein